jgi:glutamate-1-semialdehyde aminotransferase
MTIRILSGLALALIVTAAANAECVYPKEPANTPNGATASQDEMVAGMKAVKEYNGQVTAYLSCLEQEMNARIEAAGPDAPAEQIEQIKAIHTKRHNAAVEALEQHAARFNEQVKTFKSRDKKS